MKKLLFVVLLALCVFVTPVFAIEKEEAAGIWYLNGISTDGENWFSPSMLGLELAICLNEDGTITPVNEGTDEETQGSDEKQEGNWEIKDDGVLMTFDDEAQFFEFKDECLIFDGGEDGIMRFSREKPEPPFEPAEPKKDAKAADYEGIWKAFIVGVFGMYMDWESIAETLEYASDKVIIKDSVMYPFGAEKDTVELTFEEDGTMAYHDPNMSLLDAIATLREDGTLTLDYKMMTFVLEKVEEQ